MAQRAVSDIADQLLEIAEDTHDQVLKLELKELAEELKQKAKDIRADL